MIFINECFNSFYLFRVVGDVILLACCDIEIDFYTGDYLDAAG